MRRDLLRRITCYAVYRCELCGRTWNHYRWSTSLFSVHAACPRCNTRDLTRLREIDWLDERSRNPLRWMIRPFGAPLYHCGRCRFQFPDVRKLHPHARKAYD